MTFVSSTTESLTRGAPSRWAFIVIASPKPAVALYGAHIIAVTVNGVSITDQYRGALSEIALPPGASEKSRSTVQWSYRQVSSEISGGLSSGPPGVVKIRYPGVKCLVTSTSNSEHSPGRTYWVVSPIWNTIFPVLLIETLIHNSSTSNVP